MARTRPYPTQLHAITARRTENNIHPTIRSSKKGALSETSAALWATAPRRSPKKLENFAMVLPYVCMRRVNHFPFCSSPMLTLELSRLPPHIENLPRVPPEAPGVRAAEPCALRQDQASPGLLGTTERQSSAQSLHAAGKSSRAGATRRKRHKRRRAANYRRRATGTKPLENPEPSQER